jgi:hypothetical protein
MKRTILCLVALAAPLHAAELNPSHVPSSAKWMLHADFDAMRESQTGKAVFAHIEDEHGAKLQAFKRMFSLHLIHDVMDVTLFGDGIADRGAVLLHGNFDQGHIKDVLKAADDYSSSMQAGQTIHSWTDKGKAQNAAFAGDKRIVISRQKDLLRQALETLKANEPAEADPFFAAGSGRPLLSAKAKTGEIEMPEDASRILRMAGVLRIAASENDGRFRLRIGAEPEDATVAKRLRRILDGIVALGEATHPMLAKADFQAEIKAENAGVSADLSLPADDWIAILKKAAAKKAQD